MARRPIRVIGQALGRRGRTYATASVMRRWCTPTAASVPIVCKRNAGRSPINSCMPIASRASANRRSSLPGRLLPGLPVSRPTVDDLAVPVGCWVWRPRIDPCPPRRRPGAGKGARAELGPPLQAHPAPAQRGASPPRPGRNPHQHRPQLQRPPEYDIKAYGVKEDAALPEGAGTVFVR